jgi:hypothetical protein
VGDTANWEFAAAVATVCIGLGGLLLFTLVGVLGAWRMYDGAARAASEAAKAGAAVRELAIALTASRYSMEPATQRAPEIDFAAASDELDDIRKQAADLLAQQTLLQDAVRNLVEAGVLRGEDSGEQLRAIEQTLRRIEERLARITAPGAR